MNFLLVNDDGIDAPGLLALHTALAVFGSVRVIAPDKCHSGGGHCATTNRPIRLRTHQPSWQVIDGTPVDCTRIGLEQFASEVDWVISGINAGANLGADAFHSGTVAAAREAALLGKRALAISHYRRKGAPIDWELAERWTVKMLPFLLRQPYMPGIFWNMNLPHPAEVPADMEFVLCAADRNPLPVAYRVEDDLWHYEADYHGRTRGPETDVDVCFRGKISVTAMQV